VPFSLLTRIWQKSLKEDSPNPSLKSVVALLKLGDWDPDVFYKFRDVILNSVCQANSKLRNDLCRGIPRVWENYYSLDKEKVSARKREREEK